MSSNTIISLGIDIGTTNSTASKMSNGRIEEFKFPGDGLQLPSAIYYPDEEDKNALVGNKAFRAAYKSPENLFTHFKRRMYDKATEAVYGGRTAIMLVAMLLQEILNVVRKSDPEIEAILSGAKPREELVVTVTHPANWGVQQQDWLREAAGLIGLEVDRLISEPVAAAYRLREEKASKIKMHDLIAVIDWGGGTLDATVHQLKSGKLNTVVGASGDPLLGGDNITGEIFLHFCKILKLKINDCYDPERGLNLAHPCLKTQKQRRIALELWKVAAEAKEQLSTSDEALVFFNGGSGPEELTLTADEYDKITEEIWMRFDTAVSNMLAGSKYTWADIHHVGVAGGSAMARGVLKHVAAITGKPESEILLSSSSSHVVASGAAISGYNGEDADSHVGRGLGYRVLTSANGTKSYANKMLVDNGEVVPNGGANYQSTGQSISATGGKAMLKIQFVEAKPAVVFPKPVEGIPSLLDDSEVNRLLTVTREIELPSGEHEVLCGFSIANGSTHYHLSFPSLPDVEGISGRLEADSGESENEMERRDIDVLIMIDNSTSMEGVKIKNAKIAVQNVADQSVNTNVRICVVQFGLQTGTVFPFGAGADLLEPVLKAIKVEGSTPMAEALRIGDHEFSSQPASSHKLGIVVTDGHPDDADAASAAATKLKKNAELICFGIGREVDDGYLARLATSPQHYINADDPANIPTLFEKMLELFLK